MGSPWTEEEQLKVAEQILRQYSHVRFEVLLQAVRECDFLVSRADGWDALVQCVKAHLEMLGVMSTYPDGNHRLAPPLTPASKQELTALFKRAETIMEKTYLGGKHAEIERIVERAF